MALDESFIGRTYPPEPIYEVSREKIREFAVAIGDDNPLYRDAEAARGAGYRDVIAPPTFAMIISLTATNAVTHDPELGLDYSKVVHGDQQFIHHRPMVAGDRLIGQVTIDDIQSRAGNDMLTVRGEITTEAGERVCTSIGLMVARGTA
ncbi:MaoC family dehydratase [Pseudonocardiaceae bacterium YIM PH 21723]|nr:MaoC family dehydratase [Pseudonocardiaceae bacterium YIM PH 21723]